MAPVLPVCERSKAYRVLRCRRSALVCAASRYPCTLSQPTLTLAGGHFHATSGCRSTVCILGRATVPAAAVAGLSAAHRGCPSEVRFFVSNPICTRTCMHLSSNHLLTLTNMRVTGRTLYQPRNLASPGSHSPAYRPPQAFRPPEGRRSAAAKRCRGGHGRGR